MIEAKPENLIGDRAYGSDKLDEELRQEGIEMISPHRWNGNKPKTQDGRCLCRYERRWLVERFFACVCSTILAATPAFLQDGFEVI